ALEQASPPLSPAYAPDPMELEDHVPVYVLELAYPEYLSPSNDEIPMEDQPLPDDASLIALSPGYMADSDIEEDPADSPADGGDNDDEDEEEEEEHLAPVDSTAIASPVVDPIFSAKETEPFETDKSAATPPPPPAYRITSRMSVRTQTPIPFPFEVEVARLHA
ncbi:hypothetical protein Tco_0140535, partial [Tanacetum coccineum]